MYFREEMDEEMKEILPDVLNETPFKDEVEGS